MTVAVCVKCGSLKRGGFNSCQLCGFRPEAETDLAYSLALTDHYFSVDTLNEISTAMQGGQPRPSLPKDQEDQLREAVRIYIGKISEVPDLGNAP
jgi:hypothetical protein